jgi:aspartyl-tRNA(Asn)/glutamyl-tRNA(Gln) amidotransferase subunit A
VNALERAQELNAFMSLTGEAGEGVRVGVKDLIDVRGIVTTAGSPLMPDVPAERDAPVVERLRAAGCVVVGKTSLHEWAYGPTSDNPHFGPVRNPYDPGRVSGGSSGGSAVAVAVGACEWAIGTDTGGSIRIPASLSGVVGFKPSLGAIDTNGVVPLSWSLDTIGSLAPDVATAFAAVELMKGSDDALGEDDEDEYRIAVPAGWAVGLDEQTERAWRAVSSGLPEIDFPDRLQLSEPGVTILFVEAAAFHRERWAQSPERFGPDIQAHIPRGLAIPGVDYVDALRSMAELRAEAERAMKGWDAVLVPCTPIVAPWIGQPDVREPLTRFTRAFNTTGQPVFAVPAPVDGLPVGIQVVGRFGQDRALAAVARALERAWYDRRPGGATLPTDGGASDPARD